MVSESFCDSFEFIVCVVFIGSLCLFGLAGNILVVVVLRQHSSDTGTITLLLALAVVDSVLLVISLALYTFPSIHHTLLADGDEYIVTVYAPYVWPFGMIAHTCTVWLTVLVTATRYVSVCRLHENSKKSRLVSDVRCQLVMLVICATIYNIPRFFEHHPVPFSDQSASSTVEVKPNYPLTAANGSSLTTVSDVNNITVLTPTLGADLQESTPNLGDIRLYQVIYSIIIYFPVMFIIPLMALAFMNVRLMQTIAEQKRKRESMTGKRRRDHITHCIIAIVCVFVFCQTPALINQIFWAISVPECGSFHLFYTKICDLLVVLNSSCNFIIYCLFGQSFRQKFLQTLCPQRVVTEAQTTQCRARNAHEAATLPLIEIRESSRNGNSKQIQMSQDLSPSCLTADVTEHVTSMSHVSVNDAP